MKKRLIANYNITDLETEYTKMINKTQQENMPIGEKNYQLLKHENNDSKSFLLRPGSMIVDYDNNQDNNLITEPRPGEQGLWEQDLRWIGR